MQALTLVIVALLMTRLAASAGHATGLVDHPDTRKQHSGVVALSGGIGIYLTIIAGVLALGIDPYSLPMLALASLLFLVGVIDDFRHLNPVLRLALHYAAGIALAGWAGIALHNLGNLLGLGNIPLLWLAAPLTALSVAGLINAYNMIDGIDGLAASTVALPLLVLYLLALQSGHPMAQFLVLMLLPVMVFMLFNLGPGNRWLPKMFLGDAGSTTMGFLVTASLVYFSQGENALIRPVTALWLVTVPLMDMLATMLRRKLNGQKLMQADRSHLHHALMDMGLSPRGTLVVLVLWAGVCAGAGLVLEQVPEYLSLACYFIVFFGHCLLVMKGGDLFRRWRRLDCPEREETPPGKVV